MGGQFPVTGAEIQLYAAGGTGYGSGAQALLNPAVTTDSNGDFFLADGSYTCPSDSALTYLVATGGDPGVGAVNPAIAMMTATGACSNLSSLEFVQINEVSTVASVWALAPFLGPGYQVGTSATNAQGLVNAFANVNNLVDISQGISPGKTPPAGAVIPSMKLYTLANILAVCVNSTGPNACDTLFGAATPAGGTRPTDTLGAALNLARNPSIGVATLFPTPLAGAPFQPGLSTQPPDWTLAVTYSGGGLKYPASIALDAAGNVWASNFCGSNTACSSVTELTSSGQPVSSAAGFTDGSLWENYGMAIDYKGQVWVTNEQTPGGVNVGRGSLAVLNTSGQVISTSGGYFGGGLDFPLAVATDTDGSIWTANQGDSTASKFNNSGTALSASGGWGLSEGIAGPAAVAIDGNHYAWFANQEADAGSVTSISPDGSQITTYNSGGYETSGVATDAVAVTGATGHIWTANYSSSSVSELEIESNGSATVVSTGYTGGGLNHPNGIAVDGAGNVWVANHAGNTVTELEGAASANPGQTITTSAGYGADASLREPYGIAIDASGNVWVTNFGLSTITQFLGAGTPVKTPLVGPAQLP
jgi:streptogramin lyase